MLTRKIAILSIACFVGIANSAENNCHGFYSGVRSLSPVEEIARMIYNQHMVTKRPITSLITDVSNLKKIQEARKGNPLFQSQMKAEIARLQEVSAPVFTVEPTPEQPQYQYRPYQKLPEYVKLGETEFIPRFDYKNRVVNLQGVKRADFELIESDLMPASIDKVAVFDTNNIMLSATSVGAATNYSLHRDNPSQPFKLAPVRYALGTNVGIQFFPGKKEAVSWERASSDRAVFPWSKSWGDHRLVIHEDVHKPNTSINDRKVRESNILVAKPGDPNALIIYKLLPLTNGKVVVAFRDGQLSIYTPATEKNSEGYSPHFFPIGYSKQDSLAISDARFLVELSNGDLITAHNGIANSESIQYWKYDHTKNTIEPVHALNMEGKYVSGMKLLDNGLLAISTHEGVVKIISADLTAKKLHLEDVVPLTTKEGGLSPAIGLAKVLGNDLITSGREGIFHLSQNHEGRYEVVAAEVIKPNNHPSFRIFVQEVGYDQFITYGGAQTMHYSHWFVKPKTP